jgi:hypothetical protein
MRNLQRTLIPLLFFVLFGVAFSRTGDAAPADRFLYLPPGIADHVVFYHSFAQGLMTPDLNLIGATLTLAKNDVAEGLVGAGYMAGSGTAAKKKGRFVVHSPALSVRKPITAMCWWRLDEPMKEETGFGVLALRGKGWISMFVAGKGPWCALKEPTYVFQCHNFEGMENHNDVQGGRAWFEPKVWHHAAISVSGASDIRIYWDGRMRNQYVPKERILEEGDINSVEFGDSGDNPAMTLDEIVILDRALSADEIQAYVTAVKALAQVKFPLQASGH